MRTRQNLFIALLFLPIVAGAGCRDGNLAAGATAVEAQQRPAEQLVPLPNKDGSFKFAVLGDFGDAAVQPQPNAHRSVLHCPRELKPSEAFMRVLHLAPPQDGISARCPNRFQLPQLDWTLRSPLLSRLSLPGAGRSSAQRCGRQHTED